MDFKEEIYSWFDQTDKTLVFTSETVARAWLQAYVLDHPGKAVFKNRVISWDTFSSLLVDAGEDKPVSDTERRIFISSWFGKGNYEKLKYFANPSFKESKHAFTRYLAKVLPFFNFENDEGKVFLTPELHSDISLIRPAYEAFLKSHGLYEPRYLKKDLSRIRKDTYVFVFPETFSDNFVSKVMTSGLVHTVTVKNTETPLKMQVYKNAVSEIKGTLRQIEKVKETIPFSDISLTCSSLDTYRPYLEAEAKKRDIPLIFTSRKKVVEYPEGRFFQSLYVFYRDTYSIDSMKKLFLDPAFPFKDRELFRKMIRIGIDMKIMDGGKNRWLNEFNYIRQNEYLLKKYPDVDEIKKLFSNVTSATSTIIRSENASAIERLVKQFRDNYFLEGSWNATEDKLFGTCLDILEAMHQHGIDQTQDAYLLFLQILKDKSYVEKSETKEGIRVYSYPASCGMLTKVHYIIGLDDKTTRKVLDDYPFLPDEKKPEATDIGTAILGLYRNGSFSETTVISGTTEGFDGARLLPTAFLDANVEIRDIQKDSFSMEEELLSTGSTSEATFHPTKSQCTAFHSFFKKRNTDPSLFEFGEKPSGKEGKFSVSDIKSFDTCPYKGYVSSIGKIRRKEYEPEMEDHYEVGNILHETVQRALKEYGSFLHIQPEMLQRILAETAEKYVSQHKIPDKATKNHIIGRYSSDIERILDCTKAGFFSNAELLGNEVKVTELQLTPEILLEGRIDTILKDEDNCLLVLDYKTSGKNDYDKDDINGVSLQIILYAKMLESPASKKDHPFLDGPKMVKSGGFYSFNDKNFRIVWPECLYPAGNRNIAEGYPRKLVDENADERIQAISDYLKNWVFQSAPSEDNCASCDYARLCRERFATR